MTGGDLISQPSGMTGWRLISHLSGMTGWGRRHRRALHRVSQTATSHKKHYVKFAMGAWWWCAPRPRCARPAYPSPPAARHPPSLKQTAPANRRQFTVIMQTTHRQHANGTGSSPSTCKPPPSARKQYRQARHSTVNIQTATVPQANRHRHSNKPPPSFEQTATVPQANHGAN